MFLEVCMQIHTVVFAVSRQINMQKYAKTINLLCAGNKVFVKYQAQGGLTPTTPLAYALGWLSMISSEAFVFSLASGPNP